LARVAPTGTIIVLCEGGIGHYEAENAKPEDLAAGCDPLLPVMVERAGLVG
jgi:N-carbamoyl-L-amino-acid hydrolase